MCKTLRWAALPVFCVVLAVLHHTPAVNEALGGTWWWVTVAAVVGFALWRDVQSWSKSKKNRPSEPPR
jgi:hypothetical protein